MGYDICYKLKPRRYLVKEKQHFFATNKILKLVRRYANPKNRFVGKTNEQF